MISMTLEGGKELEAKLIGLERKVAKKIVAASRSWRRPNPMPRASSAARWAA